MSFCKTAPLGWCVLALSAQVHAEGSANLFGVLDLAYEAVQTASGRISGLAPSGNSSSALGLRGAEDLGAGLQASFWLEGSLNPASGIGPSGSSSNNQRNDTGAGGWVLNRRATVGLSGELGEWRLGRDYTPTGKNYTGTDPFNANGVGALLPSYTGSASANTFLRASNAVSYSLPATLGGLYGQAMLALGNQPSQATPQGPNTASNGRYGGLRVGIKQGRYDVALAYGQTRYAALSQTLGSNGLAGPGTSGAAPVPAGRFTDANLGASGEFGRFSVSLLLARQTLDDLGQAGHQQSTRGWGLGLQFATAGHLRWLASLSGARLDGAKANKLSLGTVYELSKRSALYASVARVNNSGGASMSASSYSAGPLPPVSGPANVNQHATGFDMGLRLSF